MAGSSVPLQTVRRGFGETARRDRWWIQPLVVFLGLSTFVVYATWAAFQGAHYTYGPYLSPFYSPEIFGGSSHSWFGPRPAVWPAALVFSPALLILPIPAFFRFTCRDRSPGNGINKCTIRSSNDTAAQCSNCRGM